MFWILYFVGMAITALAVGLVSLNQSVKSLVSFGVAQILWMALSAIGVFQSYSLLHLCLSILTFLAFAYSFSGWFVYEFQERKKNQKRHHINQKHIYPVVSQWCQPYQEQFDLYSVSSVAEMKEGKLSGTVYVFLKNKTDAILNLKSYQKMIRSQFEPSSLVVHVQEVRGL